MKRNFEKLTNDLVIEVIKESFSYRQVLTKLNCHNNTSNRNKLKKFIEDNKINISHFKSRLTQKQYEQNPKYCKNCGKVLHQGSSSTNKFCDNKCQGDYTYKQYITRWKKGEENGIIGTNDISNHIKRYLFEKYNNSCQCCGWNVIHPYTNRVPLQIHHIDGDCLNNKEDNLQLLCPNCHSLTENYGRRNRNCTRIDKRQR